MKFMCGVNCCRKIVQWFGTDAKKLKELEQKNDDDNDEDETGAHINIHLKHVAVAVTVTVMVAGLRSEEKMYEQQRAKKHEEFSRLQNKGTRWKHSKKEMLRAHCLYANHSCG